MIERMIKISLVGLLTSSLYGGEIQTGTGTFEMSGGFMGLDQTIDTDITTYSLIEQHSNIASSDWFYKYNLTWYDSDLMVQGQNSFNNNAQNLFQNQNMVTAPSIDYRLQGLDLNLVLGKDFIHEDENNYLGVGVMVGASIPWIDSKKDDDNDDASSDNSMNLMEKSKTEFYTYKVGPSFTARKSLNKFFSLYGSGTYAYQTATVKNDYANADLTANGTFQEYDVGIRFQPVSADYSLGWLTISPRFYATLGYRYTAWDLDDVNIDVTGQNMKFTQMDFNMNSSVTYFGLGYSF